MGNKSIRKIDDKKKKKTAGKASAPPVFLRTAVTQPELIARKKSDKIK